MPRGPPQPGWEGAGVEPDELPDELPVVAAATPKLPATSPPATRAVAPTFLLRTRSRDRASLSMVVPPVGRIRSGTSIFGAPGKKTVRDRRETGVDLLWIC
jgi:hypothetical protein